jgi:hypothetical protein
VTKGKLEIVTGPEADHYRAVLAKFEASCDYLVDHWDSLLDQYAEQWVAVDAEGVVAHGPDFDAVLADARRISNNGSLRIEFFSREPKVWTLAHE